MDEAQLNESDDLDEENKELEAKRIKLEAENADLKDKIRRINAILYE